MFKRSGTYNSELSDHALIYGIIKEKVKHHRGKVIKFRSAKHFNPENFKEHLSSVPWHVGDILKSVDDQCQFYPNKDSQDWRLRNQGMGQCNACGPKFKLCQGFLSWSQFVACIKISGKNRLFSYFYYLYLCVCV